MRSYWFKICLGALGIFAVGMIGVAIVRSGVAKVNSVVHSDEPITIPLGLVPFAIAGERLGKLDHVTLYRESPDQVSEVELTVNLADSLSRGDSPAAGWSPTSRGTTASAGSTSASAKTARTRTRSAASPAIPRRPTSWNSAPPSSTPARCKVPLLLPVSLVTELQSLDFDHDSTGADSSARSTCPATPSPPRSSARSTPPC